MARASAKKVKPRKRLTGEERRESILDAALACFLTNGYIATTINDIRETSGATTGSIYHFFDGKGALAMALLEDAVAGWSGESAATIAGRGLVLAFLAAVIGRAAERASSSRRLLGQVLEATPGAWSGFPSPALEVRWLACQGGDCLPVGSGGSHRVGPLDLGRRLLVEVTATRAAGSATARSAPTGAVSLL
jgi:AcrR family transcriptional regulator